MALLERDAQVSEQMEWRLWDGTTIDHHRTKWRQLHYANTDVCWYLVAVPCNSAMPCYRQWIEELEEKVRRSLDDFVHHVGPHVPVIVTLSKVDRFDCYTAQEIIEVKEKLRNVVLRCNSSLMEQHGVNTPVVYAVDIAPRELRVHALLSQTFECLHRPTVGKTTKTDNRKCAVQ